MAAGMANDDRLRFGRVLIGLDLGPKLNSRRSARKRHAERRTGIRQFTARRPAQGEHVGLPRTRDLFRQRVMIRRQQTGIERPCQHRYPFQMEMVKDARIDFGPIVYWHFRCFWLSLAPAGWA